MTKLEEWLQKACKLLQLQVDFGFAVAMQDGKSVRSIARIPHLGAPQGMLVFQDYERLRPHVEALVSAGYGYSVLDEPGRDEIFDLDSFREMFRDWGWAGDESDCPEELR